MTDAEMKVRTKAFGIRIVRLFRALPHSEGARIIGRQILRSGTSVGANYRAACRSGSREEFIAKLGLVLEETDETVFWLQMLADCNIVAGTRLKSLIRAANELTCIFVASLTRAKKVRELTGP
jgi:four helix bundle protein